ncbi:TetR family transcriptional regulator [Nonomuraea phyllanthi]|uniref:TetR family transcriptional regulator C-terminal domain-containing protein n=1 Tax=Nonomuraea phyllanthi TaxID=2219224 RepID=UPI0012934DA8|nr:TetR family transcriptional regulator C-terminal domain-containing protein [Nonomuraea phyllanthi]QFY11140.1 TetR family transcriptional regulator [Nonomuraea phyllanthi]
MDRPASDAGREDAALALFWTVLHAPDGGTSRCPRCGTSRTFHRISRRRAYACDTCGTHVYPASATPFAGSPVRLAAWLDAAVMVLDSPGKIRPNRVAGALGIDYRRAWRMTRRLEEIIQAGGEDADLLGRLAGRWRDQGHSHSDPVPDPGSPEDRIRIAACRIMAQRGVEATRISDIAREAGVSNASIHYYFRSKDEALLAAFRWAGDQLHATLQRLRDENVGTLEHVRRLLELSIPGDQGVYEEYLLWLEAWGRVRRHPAFLDECARMSRRWTDAVLDVFRAGVEDGTFSPVAHIDEVCERYVAISESLALRATLGYSHMTARTARRLLARFTAEQLGIPISRLDPDN